MQKTQEEECVQHHPKSALEAWSRVTPFDPSTGTSKYVDEWRAKEAYKGLVHGKIKPGSIELEQDVIHPASIRDQFTIDRFNTLVPDETKARDQACARVYDEHLPKKDLEARNTRCPARWSDCTTVNEKGEFESAYSVAKRAYQKEKKGQVVPGYCLPTASTKKSNWDNARNFTEQIQLMRDRITKLENELAKAENRDVRGSSPCAGPVSK